MGFSLTDEPNEILCPKDIREGKVSDRYLAPAISRFVTSTQAEVGGGAESDQQAKDVWRELSHLYQRWGKVSKITEGDNIRAQACNDANASSQFTRIVQRKNLPCEKDSIAKVAYDPAHIPDCNVQAKGKITKNAGNLMHGLNTTSSSKASKRWQEKQLERMADGKLN
jgi:hypothetical protein